jgi:hypothetical protein
MLHRLWADITIINCSSTHSIFRTIFFIVDPCFFCQLECIHSLTRERVYHLFVLILSVNLRLWPPPPQTLGCIWLTYFIFVRRSRDSSVGMATHYGLDGPGIESRWGRDFLHLPRPALWPTQSPLQWVLFISPEGGGVKRPGRGIEHNPPSSAEVKERVELYPYSPSGPSLPVVGWTLP